MRREPTKATAEPFRTDSGGRIDRGTPLAFTFDGVPYCGRAGDTLASALLANGVHLVGRSFKYHRPRGILSAGSEEPNALVTIRRDWRRTTPNLRATEVELYDGLEAVSQNRWPSLAFDAAGINDLFAPLLPAGFYYKTFMGPRGLGLAPTAAWARLFEPMIRRMAGLGRAPAGGDPDRYASRYAHVDVLVAGAGPAGLAAALAAAEAGASVMIADEQAEPGGSLLAETHATIDGAPAWDWLADMLRRLLATGRVRMLARTTVFGAYPDHLLGLVERISDHLAEPDPALPRERLWQVRAKELVLATGAIERPVIFPGNDRPGVMLAGAVATYLHRFGVIAGRKAVVVTAADGAYAVAADLASHGVAIERIVDLRTDPGEAALARAEAAGIAVTAGAKVRATRGRLRVSAVDIADAHGKLERISCDLVLMSGGTTPTLHLYSQARGRLGWSDSRQAFVPGLPLEHVHAAGQTASAGDTLQSALASGLAAGAAAAGSLSRPVPSAPAFSVAEQTMVASPAAPPVAVATRTAHARSFVDFQNDVTAKDVALAAREGFRSVEHLKRYTTTGMATDQGKTSNAGALGILSATLGIPPGAAGHTTYRPPYTPVSFGALAGEARGALADPVRVTPIDASARARGAIFESVGQW
ncbi:MAG: 2Fe-2S iron-sulfur cluster-binding protein, partial [Hyphomicrobiaceae bacterium]